MVEWMEHLEVVENDIPQIYNVYFGVPIDLYVSTVEKNQHIWYMSCKSFVLAFGKYFLIDL